MSHIRSVLALCALGLLLAGCEVKQGSSDVAPQSHDVGPFEVAFAPDSLYKHEVDIRVGQDAGKLEYFLPPSTEQAIEVLALSASYEGCKAEDVKLTWFYLSDPSNTRGQILSVGSFLRTPSQKRSLILAQYENIGACTRILQRVQLRRIPVLMESTQQGSWVTTQTTPTGVSRLSLKFTEWGPRDLRLTYNAACEDFEAFEGRITASDLTTTPRRFIIEITRVTQVAARSCPNLMFFAAEAVGQKIACLFEKSHTDGSFRLGCQRPSINPVYPDGFESADIQWRKQ